MATSIPIERNLLMEYCAAHSDAPINLSKTVCAQTKEQNGDDSGFVEIRFTSSINTVQFYYYIFFVVNLLFFAPSAFLLFKVGPNPKVLTCVAFFGLGLCIWTYVIASKIRYRFFRATQVDVVGGAAIPAAKWRFVILGLAVLAIGALMIAADHRIPSVSFYCGAAYIFGGGLIFFGALTGRFPDLYLRFDPEGLTVGARRWTALIPWDAIRNIGAYEKNHNPYISLRLQYPEMIKISPPSARKKASKALGGIDLAISIPVYLFGLDLPVLSAAIARYCSDVKARSNLARRSLNVD